MNEPSSLPENSARLGWGDTPTWKRAAITFVCMMTILPGGAMLGRGLMSAHSAPSSDPNTTYPCYFQPDSMFQPNGPGHWVCP